MKRLIIVLFLINTATFAQTSIYFDHITTDQGLSNPVVTSITQDYRGFMWFGTFYGLNRFDGYEMKVYTHDPNDSNTISDNRITCLFEDRRHNLWVGTNMGGLNRYDRDLDQFDHYYREADGNSRIAGNRIETIFEDTKGNLWVGTNEGLSLFNHNTKTFQSFYRNDRDPASINSNQIYSITEDHNGGLFILTNEQQLNKYNQAPRGFRRQSIVASSNIASKTARLLFTSSDNSLWIGTLDEGLFRVQDNAVHHFMPNTGDVMSLAHHQIRSILEDGDGKIWVGTDGGGISIYNPSTSNFQRIQAQDDDRNTLSSNAIYSLYKDKTGTIWVGTFGGGVNTYNPDKVKFKSFTNIPNRQQSLSNKSVLCIHEDSKGNVWIGTDGGGLNLWDKKTNTFKHFRHDPRNPTSIPSDVVKSIYEDREGNLWIGTYLGGLSLYDQSHGTFKHIAGTIEDGQPINIIWTMHEDSRGNLWLSHLGKGLLIYHKKEGTFTHFHPFSGTGPLGDYNIIAMLEDSQGNMWFGTEDHGINIYNYKTNTFTSVRHEPSAPQSLNSDHAWVLFEDSAGNIWVGTSGGGLDRYNQQTRSFEHFTTDNGLPSNIINAILEDNQGNLWLSTSKGLIKFNYQKKSFKRYTSKDGLQSNDFNINAAMSSRKGELFFGGLNGFSTFDPDKIKQNPSLPPVVLTDFQLFNKSVKPGSGSVLKKQISESSTITLSYQQSVMSFKFAALDFTSSDKNLYAYKMEGFDDDWNDITTRREVTYTNLDPAEYTFRVKASNNDGIWNEKGISIKIIVTPPWWETWWFRALVALSLASSIVTVYKIRTRNIRETMRQERLQELMVKESQLRETRLLHDKEVVELSKKRLESEVNFKNSELATSVMNVVKQNETLLKIKDEIDNASQGKTQEELMKHLRRITRTIDAEIKPDQNWNQFEQLFNQLHENFLQRLKQKFPDLTSRDLKLCAYLRMNLNSKEIAPLLGLSVRGVEDLRYRVRKKIGLDTNESLADHIISF